MQATEWPKQKQGWQPAGFSSPRLKNPGLHLLVHEKTLFSLIALLKYSSPCCSSGPLESKGSLDVKPTTFDLQTQASSQVEKKPAKNQAQHELHYTEKEPAR